jgi:hypothetical protein
MRALAGSVLAMTATATTPATGTAREATLNTTIIGTKSMTATMAAGKTTTTTTMANIADAIKTITIATKT